jgi:thymidylate kinase
MFIIYLSGIDGCGKTTQAKLLVEELQKQGLDVDYVWFRWEPSFRKIINAFRMLKTKHTVATKIDIVEAENAEQGDWLKFKRNILSNSVVRRLWLLFACFDYFTAYRRGFRKITSDVIVIDRYVDDFIIDQAINLKMPPEQSYLIKENFFLKKFHFPDFNIIIDLPAMEGYTRKSDGTSLSYLETREKYYKTMTDSKTIHLNGLESIYDLSDKIRTWVFSQLAVTGT